MKEIVLESHSDEHSPWSCKCKIVIGDDFRNAIASAKKDIDALFEKHSYDFIRLVMSDGFSDWTEEDDEDGNECRAEHQFMHLNTDGVRFSMVIRHTNSEYMSDRLSYEEILNA